MWMIVFGSFYSGVICLILRTGLGPSRLLLCYVWGWSKDDNGEYGEARRAFISPSRLVKQGWRTERALDIWLIFPVEHLLKSETVQGV